MNRAERRQQRKLAKKSGTAPIGQGPDAATHEADGDVPRPAPESKDPGDLTEAGRKLHEAGDVEGAAAFYDRALEIAPNYPDALQLLGLAAYHRGDFERAAKLISRAIKLAPRAPEYHNNLGIALRNLGRHEEAIASYRRAIALRPNYADAHNNFGVTLRDLDRTDEAIEQYRRAIADDPEYVEAHRHLSYLVRHGAGDPEIEAMERLYANESLGDDRRLHLAFALGKAYDDFGETRRAWEFYVAGNRMQRAARSRVPTSRGALGRLFQKARGMIDLETEINVVSFRNHVQALKSSFDESLFERFADAGYRDAAPIFVVGMPRSGTSLTEQILASHSRVAGAGELPAMADLVRAFCARKSVETLSDAVAKAEPGDFAEIGRDYVALLRRRGGKAPFVVDKMPSNYQFIGLIRLILPDAKVVHCSRDPRDIGLSIYKRYFRSSEFAYACDLGEIGGHLKLYADLMAHWHAVLPGFVHDLNYERLVADQREETAALLAFCGLEWEDACLEFYKTDRAIQTDAERVRIPIHAGSVGAWKNYEKELAPLIKAMK